MDIIKCIFNACGEIMRTNINLFGFPISLLEVAIFVFLSSLAMYIVHKFF